ncbi:Chloroperoxidase [Globomyces pollinis-pini]|nr:Chloroperoxidase [Globomyces pollinis-pini]
MNLLLVFNGFMIAAAKQIPLSMDTNLYIPPSKSDIRSPCPGFNTMANHGFFPRSGSEIMPDKIMEVFESVYGLDPAVTKQLVEKAFQAGIGSPETGIRLDQLRTHNAIEHDASLVHDDAFFGPNYIINQTLVNQLLNLSADGNVYTIGDFGKIRKLRYEQSLANNPEFDFGFNRQATAFAEAAVLVAVFGNGNEVPLEYLSSFLGKEKLPEGFKRRDTNIGLWETGWIAFKIKLASR